MNTLKKIGLTALGTSLVAGSAYAGKLLHQVMLVILGHLKK